ncbi:copper chaperone PCu(A)C [Qipengyuania zhejiangensis]|uniref:copper chaperone PCu(A)C n=1 Tax=Qipengyuania zhejiangensis TaxID=3077782 RepID=UPI002D7835DC|nr:copper chaperone PCu(A)C [Qipengyuania sp. Z2]
MKYTLLASLALTGSAIALAGCSQAETTQEAAEGVDQTGLSVTNARLVLPAVAGNPAAAYFVVENTGDKNLAIRSASIEGAGSAQIHETVQMNGEMVMGEMGPLMLTPGEKATFEPGGKHVMAFDLDPMLAAGGTTEMTLTVAGGKSMTADVAIVAAGDDR